MKPTIELNKEQFMDRIGRELDFNEAAMNMVDKLWDDIEGKSVSLTTRDDINAYYPAFIEDFLQIVDDRMDLGEVVDLIKECSNFDEIKGNNVNEKIKENSLFYDYPDGTEESKDGPGKVSDIRKWLKEEDKLNSEYAWRVERRGGKDIDEFGDACTAEELVEYWLEDRGGGGCKIEFIDAPHIPDDQELSVEEINQILSKDEVENFLNMCGMRYDADEENIILGETGENLYLSNWETINTKKQLKDYFVNQLLNFDIDDRVYYRTEGFPTVNNESAFKETERQVIAAKQILGSVVYDFDSKFDKCMAEFHAKDKIIEKKNVDLLNILREAEEKHYVKFYSENIFEDEIKKIENFDIRLMTTRDDMFYIHIDKAEDVVDFVNQIRKENSTSNFPLDVQEKYTEIADSIYQMYKEEQNEKDYSKPKHNSIESNKGVVAEAQVEPVLHKQK